ncbi:hypothetical protein [Arthrobacter oryzae]|uniref:Uncharacterized protein n=1 Tax=Arthrobacter oryzae TaxID=409290 RepID=A0A495EAH3_9MICC|nr:hypothetical protein [Arthrobacter oryzae]RKR13671.1 hypothetical protein C8D78_3327 [Arthrobacter oryzae]
MSFWDDFWDFFRWFFPASILFAYLFGVFAIIGQLFRDQGLNGWWKAVWVLFLSFQPVVTLSRLEPSALKNMKQSRTECWFDGVRGIDTCLGNSARILPGR